MKNKLKFLVIFSIIAGCSPNSKELDMEAFDFQGHRGARGLLPENTIPAFLKAMDLGVTTLEMDLAVTRDNELLVSHEPYFSAEICLDSTGNMISPEEEINYNIYQMSYDEIVSFDCGSKPHPRFPDQKKIKVSKPLFVEVVKAVEDYAVQMKRPPANYNIEIKTNAMYDGIYHPSPAVFGDLVYRAIDGLLPWSRITIQSFDFRVLQHFHEKYPAVRLAVLIENDLDVSENLDSLGFLPHIYSCDFELLDKRTVEDLHSQGIQVIPWTVNVVSDMRNLVGLGVDGIISDFPNRFKEIREL